MRILAVDDDRYTLELLEHILLAEGYGQLCLCSSPNDAMSEIRKRSTKFDCILLDINMPEIDGISLCRAIRSVKRYQDTPIIMLSAKSDQISIQSAFAAGATDFITKPFDVDEVPVRIRLAGELNSAKNEIRALRLRARIGVKFRGMRTDHPQRHKDNLSRDEIVQLFAEEFSTHAETGTI